MARQMDTQNYIFIFRKITYSLDLRRIFASVIISD